MGQFLTGEYLGQYKIGRVIGSGGMGIVYEAFEASLNRTVAIKVLPSNLARDKEFVQRFLREAQSAAQISHPNVLHIYNLGHHEDRYFIAMEFIRGQELAALMDVKGKLDLRQALVVARQVA